VPEFTYAMSRLHPVEVMLGLLAVAVALGIAARRLKVPYPILLVVGGLLLSLQPWAPPVKLDPQVVFFLFLPPLLYAAAFNTEWGEFRRYLRAITLLSVGLVLFSATAVAVVAHHWIGMPWAAGFALGAIVSPPDAVAAVAITRRVKVPQAVVSILEGESLLNDATALVGLRLAVAAAGAAAFSLGGACLQFAVVSTGGVLVGLVGAWLVIRLHRWLDRRDLTDAKLTITITLLTPFAVYLPAEHLHVSGVLAAVTAGLWVGNRCETVFTEELYEEARAVWEWVEFLLNSLVFILIGFQLRNILDGLGDAHTPGQLYAYAAGISAVVIVVRIVWMFPGAYLPRLLFRHVREREPRPSPRAVFVVGWTGMRGVVSLAAALALPHAVDGKPFPHRDLIQFLTFWVIFATLVGQGLTLPLVIRWLGVSEEAGAEESGGPIAAPDGPA
jgi:CPA1 family monovalent cation:H+ antiporter